MFKIQDFRQIEKIGEGKQASVYRVVLEKNGPKTLAFKAYKPAYLLNRSNNFYPYLQRLIKAPLRDQGIVRLIDHFSTWPLALVSDQDDVAAGYIMKLIPSEFYTTLKSRRGGVKVECTLDFMLNNAAVLKRRNVPLLNAQGRLTLVQQLIQAMTLFHRLGLIVGDLSSNNILLKVDPLDQRKNRLLFIDCDSFRLIGTTPPLEQPHSLFWVPPECRDAREIKDQLEKKNGDPLKTSYYRNLEFSQSTETDIWKACLAILRLYYQHPTRSAASVIECPAALKRIKSEVSRSFAHLIHQGLAEKPDKRPTIEELYREVA